MRLIDADALGIGKANRNCFDDPKYADGWNSAIEIINNAPTIEAEPVQYGRWIKSNYKIMCSRCKEEPVYANLEGYILTKRCPNCGAKMESGTALQEAEPLAECVDDADLEHMTRFAMQQAVNRK